MVLSLIQAESYAIAMRHLDHKLDTESGFIAHTIQPLISLPNQYTYVQKSLLNMMINIDKLREQIREDATKTDNREVILQAKLSEIEVKYKNIVNKTLSDFTTKAEKLRVLRTKLDNIIVALNKLLDYNLKDGVMESIQNKKDKVALLNDPVPTMAQISSILRIEQLQNQALVARWAVIVADKAQEIFDNEESDSSTIHKVLITTEETATNATYSLAYNLCKPVLEDNEEAVTFLTVTLKKSTEKFITATRNRNQVEAKALEILSERNKKNSSNLAELLGLQVAILEEFSQQLANQLAEIPQYFEALALETGITKASLVEHSQFNQYRELASLSVTELAAEASYIYDQTEELHEEVLVKADIDKLTNHLATVLTKTTAVKDAAAAAKSNL